MADQNNQLKTMQQLYMNGPYSSWSEMMQEWINQNKIALSINERQKWMTLLKLVKKGEKK